MNRFKKTTEVILTVLLVLGLVVPLTAHGQEVFNAPAGFPPPPLNPTGVRLETKEMAPGVYALLSSKPPVDNSGFVVGERGVLVIDAHINGDMARQIQEAVRQVTTKPILYLVNTNYHGDHTFGNYAFPAETRIVAHRKTAERMRDFDHEKEFLLQTVDNDPTVYADVRLRLPDVVFDDHLSLDLGGRVVELYNFGPGNTPGDTVVYVPEPKVAWTGNLILGGGLIPFLIEGGAGNYLETIARFARTLEVEVIVPGHGPMTSGAIFGRYLRYLSELIDSVRQATRAGRTLEETLARTHLADQYTPPPDSPLARLGSFITSVHRWNVQQTYKEVNGR
ncbi:MAG: MBL fold metallo-hydrolase [Nitrospiraceae bacterium]